MATIFVLSSICQGEKTIIAAYRSLAEARRSAQEFAAHHEFEEVVSLVWSDGVGDSQYVIEQIELYN